MADIQSFQTQLQYSFRNPTLLEEAFIAAGAANSGQDTDRPVAGNKRLALIGDAVLRLSVLDEWFPTGDSTGTGDNMVQEVATNEKLKEVAKDWNLTTWLEENPCQLGQEPRTTLASTVEAIIGAVWVDCNRDLVEVRRVIKRLQS